MRESRTCVCVYEESFEERTRSAPCEPTCRIRHSETKRTGGVVRLLGLRKWRFQNCSKECISHSAASTAVDYRLPREALGTLSILLNGRAGVLEGKLCVRSATPWNRCSLDAGLSTSNAPRRTKQQKDGGECLARTKRTEKQKQKLGAAPQLRNRGGWGGVSQKDQEHSHLFVLPPVL